MKGLSELDYKLKPEHIASSPRKIRLGREDLGRLMVVNRNKNQLNHSYVLDLQNWLNPGDLLILNDSKRIPGVCFGMTKEGGIVEIRFAEIKDSECIGTIYPQHYISIGCNIVLDSSLTITVTSSHGIFPNVFHMKVSGDISTFLKANGKPLASFFYAKNWDVSYLNPYFAKNEGSTESSLAALHITPVVVEKLKQKGIRICYVTLYVSGSWLLSSIDDIEKHQVMPEFFNIPTETADEIAKARTRGSRICAIGTTVMRTLESAEIENGLVKAGAGCTDLVLKPGHKFRVVDTYFTNFHPSRSSLMAVDASFCHIPLLKHAYQTALDEMYTFLEFGDAIIFI